VLALGILLIGHSVNSVAELGMRIRYQFIGTWSCRPQNTSVGAVMDQLGHIGLMVFVQASSRATTQNKEAEEGAAIPEAVDQHGR